MDKVNWVQKLGSRKFWAVLIAAVGAVAAGFGLSEASIGQITGVVGAFATLITYILVEGNIDAQRAAEGIAEGVPISTQETATEYEYDAHGELAKVTAVTTFGESGNNG